MKIKRDRIMKVHGLKVSRDEHGRGFEFLRMLVLWPKLKDNLEKPKMQDSIAYLIR